MRKSTTIICVLIVGACCAGPAYGTLIPVDFDIPGSMYPALGFYVGYISGYSDALDSFLGWDLHPGYVDVGLYVFPDPSSPLGQGGLPMPGSGTFEIFLYTPDDYPDWPSGGYLIETGTYVASVGEDIGIPGSPYYPVSADLYPNSGLMMIPELGYGFDLLDDLHFTGWGDEHLFMDYPVVGRLEVQVIPEPASVALLGMGMLGLAYRTGRRGLLPRGNQ